MYMYWTLVRNCSEPVASKYSCLLICFLELISRPGSPACWDHLSNSPYCTSVTTYHDIKEKLLFDQWWTSEVYKVCAPHTQPFSHPLHQMGNIQCLFSASASTVETELKIAHSPTLFPVPCLHPPSFLEESEWFACVGCSFHGSWKKWLSLIFVSGLAALSHSWQDSCGSRCFRQMDKWTYDTLVSSLMVCRSMAGDSMMVWTLAAKRLLTETSLSWRNLWKSLVVSMAVTGQQGSVGNKW